MSAEKPVATSPAAAGPGRRWLALLPALPVAAAMLWWTWGTWPHLFVDFGRELYVPWRLAEGDALYRDLAYFNGPLSPYWNALCFQLFGVGLRTLVLCNLVLLALLVWLLYDLLERISSPAAASLACSFFLCVFAFGQIDVIGNDNYLTPYSHEVVHGLLLSLLAIRCTCALDERPVAASLGAGLALGLAFLTKAEIFLAAGSAVAAVIVLHLLEGRRELEVREDSRATGTCGPTCLGEDTRAPRRSAGSWSSKHLALVAGGAALPPLLSLLLLSLQMPAHEALHGTLGSWTSVFDRAVTGQHFYRATAGTLEPVENLLRMVRWSSAWLVALALPVGLGFWLGDAAGSGPRAAKVEATGSRWRELRRPGALLTAALAFTSLSSLNPDWNEATRPLPLAVAVLGLLLLREGVLRWRSGEALAGLAPRLGLLVFSGVLLLKIILRVRVDQYGFALAMPATLLVVIALADWLPAAVHARGGRGWLPRAAVLGALLAVGLWFLRVEAYYVESRRHPVASGVDRFLADERGIVAAGALDEIERRLGPGDSLAVLPEGVMLNYLARRVNPSGHINFMPPELIIFGEDQILEAFRRAPPDFVLLTRKDTREYGVEGFGRDYGLALMDWIRAHYGRVLQLGAHPLGPGDEFGLVLLERRAQMPRGPEPRRPGGV